MNQPKYNLTIAPLYFTKNKNGNIVSINVSAEMFDALAKVKIGGRLLVKVNRSKKNERSPDFYLEYMDEESVAAFEKEANKRRNVEESL